MSLKDFITIQKLGQGSFGVVQRVKRRQDSQQYALKKVKYMDLKEKDKKNALNEVRILASVNHPNVIKYKEAFFEEGNNYLCTVMELAGNGDLSSRIKQKVKNNQTFYEYQIWSIGKDIINGIGALHEKNILHRDIKPANIFFGEGNVAKIGDLNVSLLLKDNLAYTQTGTPYYASPQVWNNEPYAFECDVWSFGCVLYEMCTLRKPFEAKNIDKLYQRVKKLKFDPLPYRFSYDMTNVIQKCLAYRQNRISLVQLKKIFQLHTAPVNFVKDLPRQSNNLMDTIKMPLMRRQFAACLPQAKYENPQQKSLPATQTSLQKRTPIIDRFLIPERKLSSKLGLGIMKSQKYLGHYPKQVSMVQSPSFKEVINFKSPPKSSIVLDRITAQQLNLRRRRLRAEMGY